MIVNSVFIKSGKGLNFILKHGRRRKVPQKKAKLQTCFKGEKISGGASKSPPNHLVYTQPFSSHVLTHVSIDTSKLHDRF